MQELILEEMDKEETYEESIIKELLEYESIAEFLDLEDLENMTDWISVFFYTLLYIEQNICSSNITNIIGSDR